MRWLDWELPIYCTPPRSLVWLISHAQRQAEDLLASLLLNTVLTSDSMTLWEMVRTHDFVHVLKQALVPHQWGSKLLDQGGQQRRCDLKWGRSWESKATSHIRWELEMEEVYKNSWTTIVQLEVNFLSHAIKLKVNRLADMGHYKCVCNPRYEDNILIKQPNKQ